jgi:hypothetical protein
MDSFLPFFFCFVFPLLWTIGIFAIGRWSATHTVSVRRREEQQAAASPYFANFDGDN